MLYSPKIAFPQNFQARCLKTKELSLSSRLQGTGFPVDKSIRLGLGLAVTLHP